MSNPTRMYFFTMYNLSGIQKGIQSGHAALEYVLKYGRDDRTLFEFVSEHKTFIVLNGGTSGDMLEREKELEELDIKFASFVEPDLNGAVSAIAFIVKEDDYDDEDQYKVNPIKQYLLKFNLASN